MIRIVLGVAAAALISAFLSPQFGFDAASVPTYLGFLLGLAVVLISFEVPGILVHRTALGDAGRLRLLPWTLVVAALFVLISRIAQLQPGYLYGVVLGVVFMRSASEKDEGREAAAGMIWTLLVSVVGWLVLSWLRGGGLGSDAFVVPMLQTAAGAVVVSGLEAVGFGLMPLAFMPGRAIYRWHRWAWAALFFVSVAAFIHILIGPTSGYLADLSPGAWIAALAIFALFGAVSIGFWAWFRFRPSPA